MCCVHCGASSARLRCSAGSDAPHRPSCSHRPPRFPLTPALCAALPFCPPAGPILAQAVVPVYPTDRPEQLAARVLKQEHQLYPK